jgi:hypothetical protein
MMMMMMMTGSVKRAHEGFELFRVPDLIIPQCGIV